MTYICPDCDSISVELVWGGGSYECLWRACGWQGLHPPLGQRLKKRYKKFAKAIKRR